MPELGLNIDHIATLREARYRGWKRGLPPEPSILQTARVAEDAGVDQITVHLREDRRHIQDEDVRQLARTLRVPLNLEMAATEAMVKEALRYNPQEVCLVPESREEITTEGGLDMTESLPRLKTVSRELHNAKIRVSAFIDPEIRQVEAAHACGARIVELHTGAYANASSQTARKRELARHGRAAACAHELNLQVNAGHGLHYSNIREYLEDVPHLHTLNIGHAIISRALLVGLAEAIVEMKALLRSPEPVLNAD